MMTEGDYSMSLNSDMIDFEYLEHFFRESFPEGCSKREFRLSIEEREYLQKKYPTAIFEPLGSSDSLKAWHLVTFVYWSWIQSVRLREAFVHFQMLGNSYGRSFLQSSDGNAFVFTVYSIFDGFAAINDSIISRWRDKKPARTPGIQGGAGRFFFP